MAGTDIALAGRTELAIAPGQTAWTDDQMAVLRHIGTDKATPADLKVFFHVCQRTGLDPFARQIYMVEYGGKPTIQTGIDGFRVIARRAADAAGHTYSQEDTQWCGPDGVWVDVWLSEEKPRAARSVVVRNGGRFSHVALFDEYVGMKAIREQRNGRWVKVGEEINSMWNGKPAHMIGKCAEAGAHRKAFPHDLGGLYVPEEMDHRTVQGEVVVEDTRPTGPGEVLVHAADLVAAATTEAELRDIWAQYGQRLGVEDRSRLSAAIRAAIERVQQAEQHAAPAEGEPVVEDPPE